MEKPTLPVSEVLKLPNPSKDGSWKLPILFCDDHLLALNKPAGLPVNQESDDPDAPALLPALHAGIAAEKPWAVRLGLSHLSASHQLEVTTSGVLLLARSKAVAESLAAAFGSGKILQQHHALIRGASVEETFELNSPLEPHPDRIGQMRSSPKRGKRYRTQCDVLEAFQSYTLLQCLPYPGKSGQIAAHLRLARFPLIADPDRGGAGLLLSELKRDYRPNKHGIERPLIARPALHLETITLEHPVTKQELSITAPPAKDFRVALKYLREFAR